MSRKYSKRSFCYSSAAYFYVTFGLRTLVSKLIFLSILSGRMRCAELAKKLTKPCVYYDFNGFKNFPTVTSITFGLSCLDDL